ncbi:MAG TPA: amino acid adenylation domain-containing protein [Terriglobales bacterium]|nr:amino acid adenylation domain-containing protein [Terriglobales bacterium]
MSNTAAADRDLENAIRLKTITELVSERAAVSPDATALVSGSEIVTYGELDRRSTQLAAQLQRLGLGPELLAAVCLERCPAAVVAFLAVLKAGGAYLPLDCSYPAERLSFILQDAQPAILVTKSNLLNGLTSKPSKVVVLDEETPAESINHRLETVNVLADHLAYVIYTSGSTGQPKGVQVTHGNLANLVAWHLHAFGVTAADRATQMASLGFDAAVWEVWPYLAAGASIHFVPETCRRSPELLRDWLVAQEISISFAATPIAELLMALPWPQKTKLRYLLTGADVLHNFPPSDLPFCVVNNYGPTETTVVATSGVVPNGGHAGSRPTIGRPIANAYIRLLDENLQSVPHGEVGEICIGGAGVARGYWNRPQLSAQKFIADPLGARAGARLYRSGDLGTLLDDGQIAYLGRKDEQIKIRGFRVEPNEIISILNTHSAVQASAVVAREDGKGGTHLIAYLVEDGIPLPSAGALRAMLRSKLPDYMIPASFVRLPQLPVTSNGKLDRAALPVTSASNTLAEEDHESPGSAVEERVAAVVAGVMGLPRVGIHENFFLLGGHSLLGTQLIARLHETFGVELPLRAIFDSPTPAQLAREIHQLVVSRLEAMSAEELQRALQQANLNQP